MAMDDILDGPDAPAPGMRERAAAIGATWRQRLTDMVGSGQWLHDGWGLVSDGLDALIRARKPGLTVLVEEPRLQILEGVPRRPGEGPVTLRGGLAELGVALSSLRLSGPRRTYATRILFPAQGGPALLRIVTLPHAARTHLADIVRHQISRLTPYKSDEVAFDFRVVDERAEDNEIDIELAVLPRTQVDQVRVQMARTGLAITGIGLWDDEARTAVPLNVLPPEERVPPRRPRRDRIARFSVLAHVLAVPVMMFLALLVAWAQTFWLDARLGGAKAEARDVVSLRQEVNTLAAHITALQTRQGAQVPAVVLLDSLAKLLPDGTYLERLELGTDGVRLQGLSRDASAVLRLLDQSALFTDVGFFSPVVSNSGQERFQVEAKLTGGGGP